MTTDDERRNNLALHQLEAVSTSCSSCSHFSPGAAPGGGQPAGRRPSAHRPRPCTPTWAQRRCPSRGLCSCIDRIDFSCNSSRPALLCSALLCSSRSDQSIWTRPTTFVCVILPPGARARTNQNTLGSGQGNLASGHARLSSSICLGMWTRWCCRLDWRAASNRGRRQSHVVPTPKPQPGGRRHFGERVVCAPAGCCRWVRGGWDAARATPIT